MNFKCVSFQVIDPFAMPAWRQLLWSIFFFVMVATADIGNIIGKKIQLCHHLIMNHLNLTDLSLDHHCSKKIKVAIIITIISHLKMHLPVMSTAYSSSSSIRKISFLKSTFSLLNNFVKSSTRGCIPT